MPVISLKPLHLAKSFTELHEKVDKFNKTQYSITLLSKHANDTFNKAETTRLEGDEETSYVCYMRFCSIVQYIMKCTEYKKNKVYFDGIMGIKRITDAVVHAEMLQKSLDKRYELMKVEDEVHNVFKMKDSEARLPLKDNKNEENDVHHQVQPSAVVIVREPPEGNIITGKHLYELLQNEDPNIIIFDTRPRKDYQESHIRHTVCISFPQEIIKPGLSAGKLEDQLPAESRALWKKRASVNYIVLLDWDYNALTNNYGAPIMILKKALFTWDVSTKLKRQPVFLEGGYSDWLFRYPTVTTNSHVAIPININRQTHDENPVHHDLCDYPIADLEENIVDPLLETSISSELSSISSEGPGTPKSNGNDSPYFGSAKLVRRYPISVDRSTKPKTASPSKVFNETEYSPQSTNEFASTPLVTGNIAVDVVPSKPQINRQLKPPSTHEQEQRIVSGLVRENKLADLDVQLQRELLQQEELFHGIRLKKEKEAEEAMKIELQKREENLMEEIHKLELSIAENDREKAALRKDNERLNAELDGFDRDAYKKWQDELGQLKQKENAKQVLYDQVEILRRERKKKEKDQKMRKDDVPAEISTITATSLAVHDVNTPPSNDLKCTFEKLKDEPSSPNLDMSGKKGLSRSHSSPNIAQLLEDSEGPRLRSAAVNPSFTRGNKPPVANPVRSLDWGSCRPRSKVGLRNLGNTCYMNATLQCLASTLPLAQHLLNGNHLKQIRNVGMKRTGEIGEAFVNVIKRLCLGNAKYDTPKEFRNAVGRCHVPFAGSTQQDSHEFFILLLTSLSDYLNKNPGYKGLQPNTSNDGDDLPDHVAAERVWNMQKLLENSIIIDMFYGQLRSTLKCLQCGKISTTFDNFNCLSLPIPSNSTRCTLTDCLRAYLKEERLTGASMWHCPCCKELRDAVKKLDIWKLPPILVVHLKRFIYDDIWRDKIQTNVDFTINDLEMKNYVVGPPGNSNFNLYAVSNHYGTLEGGHYVALCKISNQWIKFDDQDVYDIPESDVKSSAGYLLFYSS